MKKSFVLFSVIFIGFLVITAAGKGKDESIQDIQALDLSVQPQDIRNSGSVKPDLDFGKFPLYFIYNKGQVNEKAKFYAKASSYTLWLTKEGLIFDSIRGQGSGVSGQGDLPHSPHSPHSPKLKDESPFSNSPHSPTNPLTKYERDVSRLIFIGANKNPEIVPIDETQLKVNYFKGNDKSKWHCDIPTSQAVLYKNLYKNIDLKVYGIEKQIEYDWIVKPGGNPEDIRVEYKNVKGTRIDEEGNLLIETDFGELMHKKPVSYQQICMEHGARSTEERIDIEVKFKKIGENTYGFEVGEYDKSFKLIIDPVVLAYSTYLGGGNNDSSLGIAVDSSGFTYVAGSTGSTDFPILNQYQSDQTGYDVFITKIDTNQSGASSLIYSTYLGGWGDDFNFGIAVDDNGNAYVIGRTMSTDFPTLNRYQNDQPGSDAFVTKIDTNLNGVSSLIYSTYLGGSGYDIGFGIAVNNSENAYVTGFTCSTNFPILNQYQNDQNGCDVFVTKIDTNLNGVSSLIYSTYLGGGGFEEGTRIAADSSGNAYVTGRTNSTDFPIQNQYQTDQGGRDAFVTKIDTTQSGASSLIYSTYLGGGDFDIGLGIAVDSNRNAYVTGYTDSTDFPILNQYQADQNGSDVFVTKIDTTQSGASSLIYSTYLGGDSDEKSFGIAVDSIGNTYVTGYTDSTDFPILNQYQTDQSGSDVFVTKIDMTQSGVSSLIYSTYLGGKRRDCGRGIAVDSRGNVYVNGWTDSSDFPILNQYQTYPWGRENDAFVTKISVFPAAPPSVDTPSIADITATTAALGGNISDINGANVTERGIYWSTTNGFTPPGEGTKVSETGNWGTGAFTVAVGNLPTGTTTYFKAFATNSAGTGYTEQDSFTTLAILPTVTTTAVSNITSTSASSGGNVISDGGAVVTARGVCWSTSQNPTVSDSHTTDGTGTGIFTSLITGLTQNTTYYVRAYVINAVGRLGYGNVVTFTTAANPTISGTVTDGTNPIAGVTITFSHDGHIDTTDSDGYYSYSVEYGTSTTVTASKPGYTFTPSEYSFTNLTEDKPNQDFTTGNYISVTITNPQNEDTVSGAVTVTAEVSSKGSSAEYASALSVTKVEFYIDGEMEKQDSSSPYQHRWDTTLVANGNHTIKAKAFHPSGLIGEHEITVNVNNSTEPPHIDLNRTRLNFGAVIGESRTGSQTFLIENSGGCCLNWTAAVSDTWIHAAPLSGTANMLVTVSIDVTGLAKGSYSGTVTITDTNADNSPASVDIYLEVMEKAQELPLFGSFDTPVDGSEVFSSIPVTGWALDDVEVSKVKIYRNPIQGHEIGLVYIGDALFVEGARPDVEEKYPGYPKNYRAGWGYMMLTNKLPNNGNGTFVIIAVATDSSGNEVTLGSKTINCDNEHAVKPFGAIDTPSQGGDAFGMDFVNFGWALTPLPNTIPTDGSTIKVWVDGVPLTGSPVYNQYREDIATLFPGYNNSDGAVGYYFLDTTLYANGVHTTAWSVQDDAGNIDGIGSRYFRIINVVNKTNAQTYHKYGSVDVLSMNTSSAPVFLKRGYGYASEPQTLYPDKQGIINIVIKEDERIEIGLRDQGLGVSGQGSGSTRYFGYLAIGQKLRRLPIGSFLDSLNGIFYWHPGPGYLGKYRLVFIEKGHGDKTSKIQLRITITPKFK